MEWMVIKLVPCYNVETCSHFSYRLFVVVLIILATPPYIIVFKISLC